MDVKALVRSRHRYAWALVATAVFGFLSRMLAIGHLVIVTPLGAFLIALIFLGLWAVVWLRSRRRGPAQTLVVVSTLALNSFWPVIDVTINWCTVFGQCEF